MNKSKEIYEFLLKNALGYDNRIKGHKIMSYFDIHDHKTLRSYIETARQDKNLVYLIASESGSDGGYWIATTKSEKKATTNSLILRAEEMKKTAKKMQRKKIYGRA